LQSGKLPHILKVYKTGNALNRYLTYWRRRGGGGMTVKMMDLVKETARGSCRACKAASTIAADGVFVILTLK
jgi:hypothetical protein